MSTNGLSSWAVDLANIGAVYPFQGAEFLMYAVGVAFWLWWHGMQLRHEANEISHEVESGPGGDEAGAFIELY